MSAREELRIVRKIKFKDLELCSTWVLCIW
jgi:hypothetical protein